MGRNKSRSKKSTSAEEESFMPMFHLIREPDKLVSVGEQLLESEEWSEVTAGLVLMTGLKCDELLKTGTLTVKAAYSVFLTSTEELSREIPTLTLAENVIKAVKFIRNTIDTQHLESRSINASYLPSVIEACESHFKGLIPNSITKDNRYTQIYRSVYGTIATHWYCPPEIHPLDYRIYICGQEEMMVGKPEDVQEKIAIQLHLLDYKIGQNQKKLDERLGIKLGEPGVSIIDKFQPVDPSEIVAETPNEEESKLTASPETVSEQREEPVETESNSEMLLSETITAMFKDLLQATGCTPSQLLLGKIFEVTSKDGEAQLFLKEGKRKQAIPNVVESEPILQGISKLRKEPQIQEMMKLSPQEIEEKFLALSII